jgi:hypothetical protein
VRQLLLPSIITLSLFLLLQWLVYPLRFEVTPFGIVALEFCDNFQRLDSILGLWDIGLARNVIYLDSILNFTFAWLFYTGARLVYRKCRLSFLKPFTKTAMYLVLLPCILDTAVNVSMLLTLNGLRNETLLVATAWITIFKFALAAMVLLYLLVSLLIIYAKTKKQALRKEEEFFSRT